MTTSQAVVTVGSSGDFRHRAGPRAGITLLELVVVTAIIAILAGIVLSTVHSARGRAYLATCTSNLKQIYQALQMYEQDHGCWPGSSDKSKWPDGSEVAPIDGTVLKCVPASYFGSGKILICPSQPSFLYGAVPKWGMLSVRTNYHDFGARGQRFDQFESGFIIVEDEYFRGIGWKLPHSGGQNSLFGDGHVKWMSAKKCDVDGSHYIYMKDTGMLVRYHITFPDYYYQCTHGGAMR